MPTAIAKLPTDAVLDKVTRARELLAQARDAVDAKKVADMARAAEVYAKRQQMSKEAIACATAVKVDAMKMMGEFLEVAPKQQGARGRSGGGTRGSQKEPQPHAPPTLADVGISKKESSESQALVEIEETEPELFEKIRNGKVPVRKAVSAVKKAKKQKDRQQAAKQATKTLPPEDFGVRHGDFREVVKELEPDSVDLIFTDPPYDRDTLPLYGDMAREAARVLKPGGSLICYLGQYQIGEVCSLVAPHLRLWWTLCCLHTGQSARMTEYGIVVKWKPMLWFVKGTRGDKQTMVEDLVQSKQEKDTHEWQQGMDEATYYIDRLTLPGGFVFDPFCGGGTTAVACKKLNRRWLTCDTDEAAVPLARKRIHDA